MDVSELNEEWFRHMVSQTGEVRSDIWALFAFVNARGSGGAIDETKAIELFWETLNPRVHYMGSQWILHLDEETPPLSEEVEAALLENLAEQERACRLPGYSPDLEDSVDSMAACQYIHIGAASALRHRARDGFSDYVRQTLNEVSRVLHLYLPNASWQDLKNSGLGAFVGSTVSAFGIKSLVLSALSRINHLNGEYEEAFEMAVDASVSAEAVAMEVDIGPIPDSEYFAGIFGEENVDVEIAIRGEIVKCFVAKVAKPQHVVDAFEGLRGLSRIESWRRLAVGCDALARLTSMWGESVIGEDGKEGYWSEYWHRAEGWAKAQLSQSELRDFMRQQEGDASLRRLRVYFFGVSWGSIPERARERLVNVEMAWFTEVRGADISAVLNDLQVAAETMCYEYIWEPLRSAKGSQDLLEFLKKDREFTNSGRFPTLSDYAWVCRQPFFREFVQGAELNREEQQFMRGKLQHALNDLRKTRDQSQHDPDRRLQRHEVEPFVMMFLGVGQEGVLRRLAEIGPKLARR